jgi:NADPH:quinone reductase-like Zn-dependent oxidoreductase
MKAIACHKYGSPDVLELVDVDPPTVPEALPHLESGPARGEIVITVGPPAVFVSGSY